MDRKYAFSSLALQFAVGCDFAVLHCMLAGHGGMKWWFFPGIVLIYGPLIYLLNRWFLNKERDLRSLALFEIAAAALMTALCFVMDGWCGAGNLVFILLSVIWLTVQGALFAASSPEVRHMIKCLDVTVLILIAYSVYSAFFGLEPSSGIVMVIGFVAVCVGTAVRRRGMTLGIRGWLFTSGAFGMIFLVMMLILSMAAAQAGRGILGVWQGITNAALSLDAALFRLLQPLAELIPRIDKEEIVLQGGAAPNIEGSGAFAEGSMIGMGSIMAVLLVLLAIGAAAVIIRLGSIKLSGSHNSADIKKTDRYKREKSPVKRLIESIKTNYKVKLYIRNNKDTAKGIYLYLLTNCRKEDIRKKDGETPKEFLTRLCDKAKDLPEFRKAIQILIIEADKAFYSKEGSSEIALCGKIIRRDINKI